MFRYKINGENIENLFNSSVSVVRNSDHPVHT